ncbi:MAG: hypothetical protein IJ608_04445 [Lachnospiraceae bacterium]|nr:hypothetical protein [Lachnospiraceae bacterium]
MADRGLNTSDNIYWINGDNKGDKNDRDGYVYGQSIRRADAEFKKWVLEEKGYLVDKIKDDDGNEITFKHKSRIFPKELHVNVTKPGRKKTAKRTVKTDQKQMVYYSAKYAKKTKSRQGSNDSKSKRPYSPPEEILEDCGKEFNMELNNKYRTRQEIQRLLHY